MVNKPLIRPAISGGGSFGGGPASLDACRDDAFTVSWTPGAAYERHVQERLLGGRNHW